jgi:signal transduction histidine kinase
MFAARTAGDVARNKQRLKILVEVLGLLTFLIMGMFLFSFVILQWQITKREQTEEALIKLTNAKAKFTAMASHEIRSPLAVIKEALDIVSEGMVGSVTSEQKDVLNIAKGNIDRLGRLINNVLDFQKIESGKMEYDLRENDLNEVIAEVQKSMSVLSERKGLELRAELGEGLPKLKFDKDRVIQVLTNLTGNAISNTETGSVVLAATLDHGMVHVSVQDTGIGIPAEDVDRIFQPFEQVASDKGKKKGGTGLGLAISKEIVLAHHGNIWAESEVGKGTTCHFTLPL